MRSRLQDPDGTVWGWGYNYYGAVGDGTYTDRWSPVQVSGLTDVVAVAAGQWTSFALKRDGTVRAWGWNGNGALGDGTTTNRSTPVAVVGLTGVSAIAAGGYRAMALKTDGAPTGTLWTWGDGAPGTGLGDGTTTWRSLPIRILSDVAAISAEAARALFLRRGAADSGSLWGTGVHNGYLLSWSTPSSTYTPVPLAKGAFTSVSAGKNVYVALRRDTSLLVWGPSAYDGNGFVLGNGGTANDDPDGDGLTTGQEWDWGTDPWSADTNGDGISDGVAVRSGKSPTHHDMDGDGVANVLERTAGTDPFRVDTDGDGVGDAADCFPLDPTRTQCPAPTPGDTTPPTITLTEPTNATLTGSVP